MSAWTNMVAIATTQHTAAHPDPLTPSGTSLTEGMAFSVGIGARQQVLLSTTLLDPRSARRSAYLLLAVCTLPGRGTARWPQEALTAGTTLKRSAQEYFRMGSRGSGESTGLSACMEARMVASGYLLAAGGGRVQKAQKGEGHAQEGQRSEGAEKEGDSDMLGLWRKHECMRV